MIGIIYESRPNVTSDAAVLCIKTGNAVVLRGGSEALNSNQAIAEALQAGGASRACRQMPSSLFPQSAEAVAIVAAMDQYIDLIIPRGGHALIETVVSHARMPVIKHYHGICHVYVDKKQIWKWRSGSPSMPNASDQESATRWRRSSFIEAFPRNSSRRRHRLFSSKVLRFELTRPPMPARKLNYQPLVRAEEKDWSTEYLDTIMSLRVVDDLNQAIDHMERYGSPQRCNRHRRRQGGRKVPQWRGLGDRLLERFDSIH